MYLKGNKGVTLMALTITIIVMLIITSTVLYNTNSYIKKEKIQKLYNDIENLNSKIEDYYLKYGDIPVIGNVYCTKTELVNLLDSNRGSSTLVIEDNKITNPNDGDEYYIIDIEKLDGLTLNFGYGADYNKIKDVINHSDDTTQITTKFDEIYIINKVTHQIYYPNGIIAGDSMYYVYNIDTNQITL